MTGNDSGLIHRELTQKIIGVFYEVYNELGHGFIESVYEAALEIALTAKGFNVLRQIEVSVWFRGRKVGDFTADMPVEKSVLLELKAGRALDRAHEAQLLNYCAPPRSRSAYYVGLVSSQNSNGSLLKTHVNKAENVPAYWMLCSWATKTYIRQVRSTSSVLGSCLKPFALLIAFLQIRVYPR